MHDDDIETIELPLNDTKDERHKFYSKLVNQFHMVHIVYKNTLTHNKSHIKSLKHDITELSKDVAKATKNQLLTKTRNNTLISVIVTLWVVFSAIFGWVWDKTTSKAESLFNRVSVLEDAIKDNKNLYSNLQSELNSIKSIRGQVMTMQSDVDAIITQMRTQKNITSEVSK